MGETHFGKLCDSSSVIEFTIMYNDGIGGTWIRMGAMY